MTKMEEDRLPKLPYIGQCLEVAKKFNLDKEIKNILDTTGFLYIWEKQGVENDKTLLKTFSRRLKNICIQVWGSKSKNSAGCDTYMTFKTDFGLEKYIEKINISNSMHALARLRTRSSELKINRKCTQSQPDMGCPFCNQIETELHFIKVCPKYTHLSDGVMDSTCSR